MFVFLRRRLRKRGYVLMNESRAKSIADLEKRLARAENDNRVGVGNYQYVLDMWNKAETTRYGMTVDVLEARYRAAIERIAELEESR